MGDERLGVVLEGLLGDVADVVPGRERPARPGEDHAADLDPAIELGQHVRERVEHFAVERVAPLRVRERQPGDRLGGLVEEQFAAGE